MTRNSLMAGLPPTHPGGFLSRVVLPSLPVTKTRFAEMLGITRQTLHNILRERAPITTPVAVRLGKVCGNGPEIWLAMQQACDLAKTERELAEVLSTLPTLHAA
ncbi:MAG TPA: HigA family addiction module antitoxin [Caulobacteraceae bacterium]|nr:HigA family addiction module antitoxin [Caulobacteraceae bacterium]